MSAPPPHAKPPGDDFVLWPESLEQGAAKVNEAAIRRSLADLAPAEWVADPEEDPPTASEARPTGSREERFYPASRTWFRTTAAIAPADAADKWWQEPPPEPPPQSPAHTTAAVPLAAPTIGAVPPESAGATALLSPEEIWELAAEELAQSSRLGAPAAAVPVAAPPPEPEGATLAAPAPPPTAHLVHPHSSLDRPPPGAPAANDSKAVAGPAPHGHLAPSESVPFLDDAPVQAHPPPLIVSPALEVKRPPAFPPGVVAPPPTVTPPTPVAPPPLVTTPAWENLLAPEQRPAPDIGAHPEPRPRLWALEDSSLSVPVPASRTDPEPAVPSVEPRHASVPLEWDGAIDLKPVGGSVSGAPRSEDAMSLPAAVAPVPLPVIAFPAAGTTASEHGAAGSAGAQPDEPWALAGLTLPENLPPPRAAKTPAAAVSLPLEADPLPAIPVQPHPPVALRSNKGPAELPTQRRTVLPERGSGRSQGRSARAALTGGEAWPEAPGGTDEPFPPSMDEVPPEGERRRRRQRREGRRSTPSSDSPVPWARWLAGILGVVVVVVGVVAMVARDHLPPEWRRSAEQWYQKAHQLIFPHQHGHPRRGIQPRAGQPSNPAAPPPPESRRGALGDADPVAAPPAANPVPENPVLGESPASQAASAPPPSTSRPDDSPVAVPVDVAASPSRPTGEVDRDPDAFTLWAGDEAAGESVGAPVGGPRDPRLAAPLPASGDVVEGQKAVRSLISARSVEEVLPWIFDAQTLEATVRAYHSHSALLPLTDAVIEHEYSGVIPATGGKAHIFNVLGPAHPRGFPVSAESTPQGYRIDWQSYIQWRDAWLRRFLQSSSSEPHTLFVVLRRTHYFNDDVPSLDDKLAFKVTSAVPGDEGAVAFVDKKSAVGRSLADNYEWRTLYFPVVELQWVPDGTERRHLRLNRIVRPTWRRIGE